MIRKVSVIATLTLFVTYGAAHGESAFVNKKTPDRPGAVAASSPNSRLNECKSVAEFGAVPDQGISNTMAFQATYNAAGAAGTCVVIPAGTYDLEQLDISAYNNITTFCANRGNNAIGGTRLRASTPTTPAIFNVGVVSGIYFDGCTFTSRSQQTAGSFVRFLGTKSSGMSNFFMEKGYDPLVLDGGPTGETNAAGTGGMHFQRGSIRDFKNNGITIVGGQDQYFVHLIMDQADKSFSPNSCFYVPQNGGSIVITDSDFLHCHNGLWMDPGPGQFVSWVYTSGVFFDTMDFSDNARGGVGILGTPHGGGILNGLQFQNTWTSTGSIGVRLLGDDSSICSGAQFTNLQALNNLTNAVTADYCDRVTIVNASITGNSAADPGTSSGIFIGRHQRSFSLAGGYVGGPAQNYAVRHRYNVETEDGFSGLLTIVGTDMRGATAESVHVEGTPAIGSSITSSPGFNPRGPATLDYGGSPWSYKASLAPETVAFVGGSCSAIYLKTAANSSGFLVANTSNVSITLAPLQMLEAICSVGPVITTNSQ